MKQNAAAGGISGIALAEERQIRSGQMSKISKKVRGIIILILILITAISGIICLSAKPEIILTGDKTVTVTIKDGYQEPGYKARFLAQDITPLVKVDSNVNGKKVGEYFVNYSVNFLNKTADATRVVKVVDKEPPVITLCGGDSITVKTNGRYDEPGYKAMDDTDGDISKSVTTKGIVDTYHPGKYTISYSASDSFGNTATAKRIVTVEGEPSEKTEKKIYLTFDDGPGEAVTPRILDILKKYNIPATFFIIDYGQNEKKIKLLKSAIAQGHTIGIHGYSHDYEKIYKSSAAFMENIGKLEKKIKKDLNYKPFIMRFPGGSSNTVSKDCCKGIMSDLVNTVQEEGFYYTDWNVDSSDASASNISADQIIYSVKTGCENNRCSIVLMHDSDSKKTTADALPAVIEWAKKEGYTFAAMGKGGPTVHHTVNN